MLTTALRWPESPSLRHTGAMESARRHRSTKPSENRRRRLLTSAAAAVAVLAAVAAPAGASEAPSCSGVVLDASMSAGSIPGGGWSVTDACVPAEAVYETDVLGYRLVGGMGAATYADGHLGRIAFLTARVSPDRSLTLLGLEDVATGTVSWAYSDGAYSNTDDTRVGGGAANAATIVGSDAPGPVEAAYLELAISGSGTDLASAQGPIADQVRELLDQAIDALAEG